jgi:hypothetical protein
MRPLPDLLEGEAVLGAAEAVELVDEEHGEAIGPVVPDPAGQIAELLEGRELPAHQLRIIIPAGAAHGFTI